MKILLLAINSQFIHTNPAVYSLKACCGVYQKNVSILETTINHRPEKILESIYEKKPDVIAISCYIWNIFVVEWLLPEIPKVLPNIPIWLGGPEVSFRPQQLLNKYPMLTGIMVGEGEKTFATIVSGYCENHEEPEKISGIVVRGAASLPQTEDANLLPQLSVDLNEIPFWYGDENLFQNRIIYYESSRGCPYRCSYCLSSIDKQLRFRTLENTLYDLSRFLKQRVPQVKFIDRTFNCKKDRAREIWRYLAQNDNGVTNFHFEIAGDLLEEEDFTVISKFRPGLVQFEIGVQTTNSDTLKAIGRTTDMNRLKENILRLREHHNVHIHLDLIAGLPMEDYTSFQKSFNDIYDLRPEQLQLGFLKVLSGTVIEQQIEKYQIKYLDTPPYEVLSTAFISYSELLKLKRIEEMLETYGNSNQFVHTIQQLERAFTSPFEMFDILAEYYEEKGFFVQSPARIYRYEVLFEFAKRYDSGNTELYRELLTYDAYLRENLKTRPQFAKTLQDNEGRIRRFYRSEEENRRYLPDYAQFDARQMIRMTHMEEFQYAVWSFEGEKLEEPGYVLFDYKYRNPLNEDARTVFLSGEEI